MMISLAVPPPFQKSRSAPEFGLQIVAIDIACMHEIFASDFSLESAEVLTIDNNIIVTLICMHYASYDVMNKLCNTM